jgi:small subunit ribosomal protein S21
MIIINVKDGESLDKALKRFKKKFEKTGVLRELRSRQAFEKKSITRRHEIKACHLQAEYEYRNCLIFSTERILNIFLST